jgi:hypothetical protein
MGVLRGGSGSSQSELPCITRPLWLRTVTHRPVGYPPIPSFGRFGCVRVFYFDQYYIFIIIIDMIKIFKSKFERLGYNVLQCLVWAVISETGIYFVHYIIIFIRLI